MAVVVPGMTVGVAVLMVVVVVVVTGALVDTVASTGPLDHLDVIGGDPGPHDPPHLQLVTDTKAAECQLQLLEGDADVEERSQDHVPCRTGKAVEIQHACHQPVSASLTE